MSRTLGDGSLGTSTLGVSEEPVAGTTTTTVTSTHLAISARAKAVASTAAASSGHTPTGQRGRTAVATLTAATIAALTPQRGRTMASTGTSTATAAAVADRGRTASLISTAVLGRGRLGESALGEPTTTTSTLVAEAQRGRYLRATAAAAGVLDPFASKPIRMASSGAATTAHATSALRGRSSTSTAAGTATISVWAIRGPVDRYDHVNTPTGSSKLIAVALGEDRTLVIAPGRVERSSPDVDALLDDEDDDTIFG